MLLSPEASGAQWGAFRFVCILWRVHTRQAEVPLSVSGPGRSLAAGLLLVAVFTAGLLGGAGGAATTALLFCARAASMGAFAILYVYTPEARAGMLAALQPWAASCRQRLRCCLLTRRHTRPPRTQSALGCSTRRRAWALLDAGRA